MSLSLDDTIAAIASAPGGAVRGIVRVTGLNTLAVLERCCDQLDPPLSTVRRASMLTGRFALPAIDSWLDVNVLVWPNSQSYTGQPSAELHLIGSPPLIQAVLDQLCRAGCRAAAPGEFTLRAVLTGRIDLTQAEAVLGVINAAGDRELQVALDQLAGGFGAPLRKLRGDLLDALAHLEAGLDFVEEDIEFVTRDELRRQLADAIEMVQQLARRLDERATSVDLPRVVLVGEPNAGKSSLFNALTGRPQALVSDVAGTTRDYLAARVVIDGIEFELVDTAGVDELVTQNTIDASAQRLAHQQHEQAQVQLVCLDSTRAIHELWPGGAVRVVDSPLPMPPQITVLTKCDHVARPLVDATTIATSARTGAGLDALCEAIRRQLADQPRSDTPVVATTAARCRESLHNAAACLVEAARLVDQPGGEELIAAEMRMALDSIGEVVGAIYTDDILDRIFSRFCIGK